MSKLIEARNILATGGVTARRYFEESTGCHCAVGALRRAYMPTEIRFTITPPDDVMAGYSADILALFKVLCPDEPYTMWSAETRIMEFNDQFFNCYTRADAAAEVIAVFDRAIAAGVE